MKQNVLVITSTFDKTVDYIIDKYSDNINFCRFNIDVFSSYRIDVSNFGWCISSEQWKLKQTEVSSIYYRKPQLPDLHEFQSEYRFMIAKDIASLINGIADSFDRKVLTKPGILRKTENKAFQLLYSIQNNITIPLSYIGNSREAILQLSNKEKIIKPLSIGKLTVNGQTEIYQTNYFCGITDNISLMPLYIQEYVQKKYEVRLTCIDNNIFAVRIDSKDLVDWRKNFADNQYKVIKVPEKIEFVCKRMLKDFDLIFGAFDFIVNKDDEWIFLEVNPNGQWLWLEKILDIPISEKIITYLVGVE